MSVSWCLLWPAQGLSSPATALREYKTGKYQEALKEYERLLQARNDDPRLHFNAGAAAYRNRQFDEAAKQFNATLASPDLKLQGLAYYNEGNALYHLGDQSPDPKKRTEFWEKALQDYQSSAKLNPQDADAKFNYEFVKKKLEELKQQQQQSQQNNQDQKQNQDQQQQDQNQQKQDQQKNQEQQQAQQNQKQDASQQQQQQQANEQKKPDEQKQAAEQSQEQKQAQQQAQQSAGQSKEQSDEKEQEAAAAQALAQMTPEQAKQLLDAQKGEEQMLPIKPTGKPADRSRPIKDW